MKLRTSAVSGLLLALVLAFVPASASTPVKTTPTPVKTVSTPGLEPGVGLIAGVVANPGDGQRVIAERLDGRGIRQVGVANDGTYVMDVHEGSYRVTFVSRSDEVAWEYFPGVRTTAAATVVRVKAQHATIGVNATLDLAGAITGTVHYPPGVDDNHYGSVVAYFRDGPTWRPVPTADTDRATPQFVVGNLPTGTYRLQYVAGLGDRGNGTATGFLGGTDDPEVSPPVEVLTGKITQVDVTPRPAGTLTGRIVDRDGTPVAGAEVGLLTPADEGWDEVQRSETDLLGFYHFTNLGTRRYYLNINPPSPYQYQSSGGALTYYDGPRGSPSPEPGALGQDLAAAQANTWPDEVVQRAGTLEGTVRDPQGHPLEGMVVGLRPGGRFNNDGSWNESPRPTRFETTDAEGHYSFGPLDYAPYDLTMEDPDGIMGSTVFPSLDADESHAGTPWLRWAFVEPEKTLVVDGVAGANIGPETKPNDPLVGELVRTTFALDGHDFTTDPGARWQWFRDGQAIRGATSPSYRTSLADLGRRLKVTVPGERRGVPVTFIGGTFFVRYQPVLRVTARSTGPGRVRLTITATAKGVPASRIDGVVDVGQVRRGADHMANRSMKNGRLVIDLVRQPRGKRTYKAAFQIQRTRALFSKTASRTVTVR